MGKQSNIDIVLTTIVLLDNSATLREIRDYLMKQTGLSMMLVEELIEDALENAMKKRLVIHQNNRYYITETKQQTQERIARMNKYRPKYRVTRQPPPATAPGNFWHRLFKRLF